MGKASPDAAIGLEQPENLDRYRIKTANLADLELSFPTGAQHTFLGGQPPAESSGFFTSIGFVRLRAPVLWPGSAQLYKTLRGKSAGGPSTVFKYPATSLNKG